MTGRGRVLVVDDDPQVIETLRDFLDHLGYEASAAGSGEEAIAAMTTVQPQVVLLDLLMPGISGLEALTYFREHHPTVPVIVITGAPGREPAQQARTAGAFDVLRKPFDLDDLRARVAQALRLATS